MRRSPASRRYSTNLASSERQREERGAPARGLVGHPELPSLSLPKVRVCLGSQEFRARMHRLLPHCTDVRQFDAVLIEHLFAVFNVEKIPHWGTRVLGREHIASLSHRAP